MTEEVTTHSDDTESFGSDCRTKGFCSGSDKNVNCSNVSNDNAFCDIVKKYTGVHISRVFDPAVFVVILFFIALGIWCLFYHRKKRAREEREAFFMGMDGDKFNIKLPAEVDEYYEIKLKCEESGWIPGKPNCNTQKASKGPTKILAQALMKRAIADIPLVTHIQKESAGMNKLYSQSMCSVKQWKTYQAAETLISNEVEEVRSEADEIETGWSELVWRQAMQYHNMLKNKHEMEKKQRLALEKKAKMEEEARKKPRMTPEELRRKKEIEADKAAEDLLKMEEREKESKKAFSNSGIKKGFLEKKMRK